jgi:hypothetical protein
MTFTPNISRNYPTQKKSLFRVLLRPQKLLGMPIERFFASLRFEQKRKLDQLGIEIGSFEEKIS